MGRNFSGIKDVQPFLILCGFSNAFLLIQKKWVSDNLLDRTTLIVGNNLLFVIFLLSFIVLKAALQSANNQAFLKGFYASFILKFFLCAIFVFAYVMAAKKEVNKPSLFICMGFYALYTCIELFMIKQLIKKIKNAQGGKTV